VDVLRHEIIGNKVGSLCIRKYVLLQAHRGMAIGAHYIKTDIEELGILTKAFLLYPHYKLAITGMLYQHSCGFHKW
jgi:uncharacterized membrane protein YpjA